MNIRKISVGATVIFLILAIIAATGWVLNVLALANMLDAGVTGMLVARAIGIFVAPLGVILGLFF